jgi:hypothetical protein
MIYAGRLDSLLPGFPLFSLGGEECQMHEHNQLDIDAASLGAAAAEAGSASDGGVRRHNSPRAQGQE